MVESHDELDKVDFSKLILGLSSAALYYLGETSVGDKRVEKIEPALGLHNIRIVEMLNDKTKGNLTENEQSLMAQILQDLRTKYDAVKKSQNG